MIPKLIKTRGKGAINIKKKFHTPYAGYFLPYPHVRVSFPDFRVSYPDFRVSPYLKP